jgi:hypothetical protein
MRDCEPFDNPALGDLTVVPSDRILLEGLVNYQIAPH